VNRPFEIIPGGFFKPRILFAFFSDTLSTPLVDFFLERLCGSSYRVPQTLPALLRRKKKIQRFCKVLSDALAVISRQTFPGLLSKVLSRFLPFFCPSKRLVFVYTGKLTFEAEHCMTRKNYEKLHPFWMLLLLFFLSIF